MYTGSDISSIAGKRASGATSLRMGRQPSTPVRVPLDAGKRRNGLERSELRHTHVPAWPDIMGGTNPCRAEVPPTIPRAQRPGKLRKLLRRNRLMRFLSFSGTQVMGGTSLDDARSPFTNRPARRDLCTCQWQPMTTRIRNAPAANDSNSPGEAEWKFGAHFQAPLVAAELTVPERGN